MGCVLPFSRRPGGQQEQTECKSKTRADAERIREDSLPILTNAGPSLTRQARAHCYSVSLSPLSACCSADKSKGPNPENAPQSPPASHLDFPPPKRQPKDVHRITSSLSLSSLDPLRQPADSPHSRPLATAIFSHGVVQVDAHLRHDGPRHHLPGRRARGRLLARQLGPHCRCLSHGGRAQPPSLLGAAPPTALPLLLC